MNDTRHTASASRRIEYVEIDTWTDVSAPPNSRWSACLREYDLGAYVATGRTQRQAINELLDYYEEDNGELRETHVSDEQQVPK